MIATDQLQVLHCRNRDTWLDARRLGIGSSDAASLFEREILEESNGEERPFLSRLGLYAVKTGAAVEDDLASNSRVKWGNRLEAAVADAFREEFGAAFKPLDPFTIYRRADVPMHATPDRIVAGDAGEAAAIVECKTAGAEKAKRWGESGDESGVPLKYQIQVQHQLAVLGLKVAYVAVLIGGNDFRHYRIEANADFERALVRRVREFWRAVDNREAPEPGPLDLDVVRSLYRNAKVGSSVRLDTPDADALLDQYERAKAAAKQAEAEAASAQSSLMAMLGEHEEGVLPSGRTVLWRATTIRHKARPAVEAWEETARRFRVPN